MRMFNVSRQDQLKAHILAIKNRALLITPESNEHLRILLAKLQKNMPDDDDSRVFFHCQQAVNLIIKSRFAGAAEKSSLMKQAIEKFDVAINSVSTELKKDSIPQQLVKVL